MGNGEWFFLIAIDCVDKIISELIWGDPHQQSSSQVQWCFYQKSTSLVHVENPSWFQHSSLRTFKLQQERQEAETIALQQFEEFKKQEGVEEDLSLTYSWPCWGWTHIVSRYIYIYIKPPLAFAIRFMRLSPLLGKTVWRYGILKNSFCSWHPKVIHFWHRKMKMRPRTWMIWSLQKELPPFTVAWPGWTVVWPCGAVCLNPYPPCSGKPWPTCFGGRTVRSFESRIRFNRFAETTHRPWYLGMSMGDILEAFQNMLSLLNKT